MKKFVHLDMSNPDNPGKDFTLKDVANNKELSKAFVGKMDKIVQLRDAETLKEIEMMDKVSLAGFGRDEASKFFTDGLAQYGVRLDLYLDDPTIDMRWNAAFKTIKINKNPYPFHNFGYDFQVTEMLEGSEVRFQTAWGEKFSIEAKNYGTGAMIHDYWIEDNLVTDVETVLNEAPKEFARDLGIRGYGMIFDETNYGTPITVATPGNTKAIVDALNLAGTQMMRTLVTVDDRQNNDTKQKAPFWHPMLGSTLLVYAPVEKALVIQEALDEYRDNGRQKTQKAHFNFIVIGTLYKPESYNKAIVVPPKSSHTFINYKALRRKSKEEVMQLAKKWIWHSRNNFHLFGKKAADSAYPGRVIDSITA